MTRLMPQQESSGSGAVHMGHVSGSVHNITQVHHHFYAAALPEQMPPAPTVAPAPSVQTVAPVASPVSLSQSGATAAQKDVLGLMNRLPEPVRIKVLEFMRREFKTGMVIELQPNEVYRVRKYVEMINQRSAEQKVRA